MHSGKYFFIRKTKVYISTQKAHRNHYQSSLSELNHNILYMAAKIFDEKYAKLYDLMYCKEKDYSREVSFLMQLFEQYAAKPVVHILDLACGTGGHAIELSKRGYQVRLCVDGSGALPRRLARPATTRHR